MTPNFRDTLFVNKQALLMTEHYALFSQCSIVLFAIMDLKWQKLSRCFVFHVVFHILMSIFGKILSVQTIFQSIRVTLNQYYFIAQSTQPNKQSIIRSAAQEASGHCQQD